MSTDGGGGKRRRLPRVVALVGPDHDEDLDDIDPNIKDRLEGKVQWVTPAEAFEEGTDVEGALIGNHGTVDAAVLARLGDRLAVVSNYGVGIDHINVADCDAAGVKVGNTPGVLSEDVADFAWALLLGCARRVGECDAYARSGDFTKYLNMVLLGTKVTGKTIGIVGMGRIGLEIGKRARGFGMKILYHNRTRKPDAEAVLGDCVYVDKLYDMVAEADFVVLICPLTGATKHLIDAEALGHFKKGSILINIARGGVVDTAALTDALTSADRLAAAGLDVTEPEPLPRDHPLLSLRNVILAPHRGSGTVETRAAMTDLSTKNLLLGLAGDELYTPCNIDIQRKGGGAGEGKE